MMLLIPVLLALWSACTALASSAAGSRVLAVVSDGDAGAYAPWLDALRTRGFQVTLRTEKDSEPLTRYGEAQFDHVALLAPAVKQLPAQLRAQELVSFAKQGGNLLVALSPELSEAWRAFAREFSLEFGERDAALIDHFGVDVSDSGDHTAVLVGGPGAARGGAAVQEPVFTRATLELLASRPFVYRGAAHWVGPNALVHSLLAPPASAYQAEPPNPEKGAAALEAMQPLYEARPLLTGFDAFGGDATASLASAMQLRESSARVTFVGSTALFQSLYSKDAVQRAVVDDLVSWTFQERGVLRVVRTAHERVRRDEHDVRPEYEEEPGVAKMYRIKDFVAYSLDLEAWDGQQFAPAPPTLDLQVSAWMLDPYVTVPLRAVGQVGNATRYATEFQLPDRHGVYTMKVNWKRPGWTYVVTHDTAPVRPFNHNEYPRMLSSSWPYVAGAFSTMAGFSLFVYLWLITGREKVASKVQ